MDFASKILPAHPGPIQQLFSFLFNLVTLYSDLPLSEKITVISLSVRFASGNVVTFAAGYKDAAIVLTLNENKTLP